MGNNEDLIINSSKKKYFLTKKKVTLIWLFIGIIALLAFGISTTYVSENLISTTGNGSFLGSFGIGTSTPSQALDVRGQGNFSGILYYNNNTLITILNDTILIYSINSTTNIQNLLGGTNISQYAFNQSIYANSYTNALIGIINTTGNIQQLLNSTGVYSIPLTINQTTNIQQLLAGTNISQYAFNQSIYANSYTNALIGQVNTSTNIWQLINGFFTNIAWKNQTNTFSQDQVLSKNLNVTGNISLDNDAVITRTGTNTSIGINSGGRTIFH